VRYFEAHDPPRMGPWALGPKGPWPMGPRAHGHKGPGARGPMGPRSHGPKGPWARGLMDQVEIEIESKSKSCTLKSKPLDRIETSPVMRCYESGAFGNEKTVSWMLDDHGPKVTLQNQLAPCFRATRSTSWQSQGTRSQLTCAPRI